MSFGYENGCMYAMYEVNANANFFLLYLVSGNCKVFDIIASVYQK